MTIMNLLKTTLTALLMLATGIAALTAQSNVTLPDPILPRNMAGKFVPKLEELRIAASKNQWKECAALASQLGYETAIERKSRGNGVFDELSKEEFVAREWLFYYVCKKGLPTIKEMWELEPHESGYYRIVAAVLRKIPTIGLGYQLHSSDEKKQRRIRAAWMAVAIYNFRYREKELEDESLAITSGVRLREYRLKTRRTDIEKLIKQREFYFVTQETHSERKYRYQCSDIGKRMPNDYQISIRYGEISFLNLLLESFPNDTKSINEYIKMAGYTDDYQRAMLWQSAYNAAEVGRIHREQWANFAKRMGFTYEGVNKLADKHAQKKEAEIKSKQERWKNINKTLLEEERQLNSLIYKKREEYRKEQEAKAQSAPASASLPPAAPAAAPAKP